MKKIIWIDDSIKRMDFLARNLFPELWKKEWGSSIIFFGDHYKGESSCLHVTTRSLDMLAYEITGYYRKFCEYDDAILDKNEQYGLWPTSLHPVNKSGEEGKNEVLGFIEKNKVEKLWIGLDLLLFLGEERLDGKSMSMILYDELLKLKYNVFLYSTYLNSDDYSTQWKNMYNGYPGHSENIRIFSRGKIADTGDNEQKELIDLLSKTQG